MIEQYVFNKIVADSALQTLLSAGGGKYHLYPVVIPRGINFDRAITFNRITSFDAYPTIQSVNIQFNIFTKTYGDGMSIATALANLFNEDNNQSDGGVSVVYSQRTSETDLGRNFDDTLYQREATFYFKIR